MIYARNTLLLLCLTLISSALALGPSSEHGLGFLKRVRNNSEYPIDFSQEKTILDYLPDGTVLRIKSLRKEYGVAGRYYAARKLVGAYRLEADTLDPNDPATHFVVKRYVARDFSEYMGLYSDFAEGQFMKSDDSRAVTFSLPDIMDDKSAEGHWTVVDVSGDEKSKLDARKFMDPNFAANVFNACYLKSRVSGFMQSRGKPQNYPGLSKSSLSKNANAVLTGSESSSSGTDNQTTNVEQQTPGSPDAAGFPAGSPPTSVSVAPTPSVTAYGKVTPILSEGSIGAYFIDESLAVVVKQNGSVARQKGDGAWESLNQGLSSGASFTSLGAADDGTLWGCDINNNLWEFNNETSTWKKVLLAPSTGAVAKISAGGATNIWALSKDGTLFQRFEDGQNTSWKVPDAAIGNGGIRDVSAATDGTVFAISNDNKIFIGTKTQSGYSFSQFCSPLELVGQPPYTIAAGSKSFVAFATPSDEVYVLVTGKPGTTKDSWKKLTLKDQTSPLKLRNFSAYKNSSIVGVVSNSGKADDNTVIMINDITTA